MALLWALGCVDPSPNALGRDAGVGQDAGSSIDGGAPDGGEAGAGGDGGAVDGGTLDGGSLDGGRGGPTTTAGRLLAAWVDGGVPLSLRYDGGQAPLGSWARSVLVLRDDAERTEVQLSWTAPQQALVVRVGARLHKDVDALEATLSLAAPSSGASALVSDVAWVLPLGPLAGGAAPTLDWTVGGRARVDDFTPREEPLLGARRFTPFKGRSSDGVLPYFALRFSAARAALLGVGWPGQWAADFSVAGDAVEARVGLEATAFTLRPSDGEVPLPSVLLVWTEVGQAAGQNRFRRALRGPLAGTAAPTELPAAGSSCEAFDAYDEASQRQAVAGVRAAGVPLSAWWVDTGWYVPRGAGATAWLRAGDWRADPQRFPAGSLRPLADVAHDAGLRFVLWEEIERVSVDSALAALHPDWLLAGAVDVVVGAYHDGFGRDPLPAELTAWLGQPESGAAKYQQILGVMRSELKSPAVAPTRRAIVEAAYLRNRGSGPEPSEVAAWEAIFTSDAGATYHDVASAIRRGLGVFDPGSEYCADGEFGFDAPSVGSSTAPVGHFNLLDLSNPAALAHAEATLERLVSDNALDVLRQDFNLCPLHAWRSKDSPGEVGLTEAKYVRGLFQLWDGLRQRHPQLLIDDCASGGRRLDFETLRRSVPLYVSDLGGTSDARADVWPRQHAGLARWLPLRGGRVANTFDPYAVRAGLGAPTSHWAYNFGGTATDQCTPLDGGTAAALARHVARQRALQPLYTEDYYALTPAPTTDGDWVAWQYHAPARDEGLVEVFRPTAGAAVSMTLQLHALTAGATYRFEPEDGVAFEASTVALLGGGFQVQLPAPRTAARWTYRRVP